MQSDDNEKNYQNVIDDSDDDECVISNEKSESSKCNDTEIEDEVIYVPDNPKTWDEKDVQKWVEWASKNFNINPPLDGSRFPKSGEELAKFTKADFYIICGSFDGGKMVAEHFKYMMGVVSEKVDATLLSDEDPSECFMIFRHIMKINKFLIFMQSNKKVSQHKNMNKFFP